MKWIWLIVLGGAIQIPATLNGNIAAAIVLGVAIGAILTLLIAYFIMERLSHDH